MRRIKGQEPQDQGWVSADWQGRQHPLMASFTQRQVQVLPPLHTRHFLSHQAVLWHVLGMKHYTQLPRGGGQGPCSETNVARLVTEEPGGPLQVGMTCAHDALGSSRINRTNSSLCFSVFSDLWRRHGGEASPLQSWRPLQWGKARVQASLSAATLPR